jgi:hypothetical protein
MSAKVKMQHGGEFCCVPQCSNSRLKTRSLGRTVAFYRIPANVKRRQIWLQRIRRDRWQPRAWDRVCSDHFVAGYKINQILTV